MKSFKRVTATVIAVAMVLMLFSVNVFAASTELKPFLKVNNLDETSIKVTGGDPVVDLDVYMLDSEGNGVSSMIQGVGVSIPTGDVIKSVERVGGTYPNSNVSSLSSGFFTVLTMSNSAATSATEPVGKLKVTFDSTKIAYDTDYTFAIYNSAGETNAMGYNSVDTSNSVSVRFAEGFEGKTAEYAGTTSFAIGTDVAAELAKGTATVKNEAGDKTADSYAIKDITAPAEFDAKKPGTYAFTATVVPDESKAASWTGDLKVNINVTLTALTTGTFSIDGKDANVFQEAGKTYTADEVANLVKAAVTAINVTSGEITDTYDAAAATYTAADTLAADTIGTSVDVTVKVSGESANKLFNVATDTVVATIAVKVVAAEITDPTQVSAKISTDSVTTSTSSLKITVTRAEARKAETGKVVVKAYKQGDDTKNVEVTGAFDADATSLELELKGAEFEALMDTLSVGNKFQIDVTYDDAAVYASDAKEPILLPVANASSGSKPSGIPSGGSSTKAQYNITVAKTENGTVSVAAKAAKGDTVTITTTADKGYKLDKIVVTTSNGTNVPVTDKTFTMPAYNVTITATFVEGEEEPVNPTPGEDTKSEFTDLPSSHWAYEAVTALKDLGIVNGVSADSFAPDNNVTRAEFTKMVAVLFGLKATSTESKFADCGADDWFTPYVLAAAEAGYVNGVDDTHFAPDAQITRQDICTILGRVLDANEAAAEAGFTDADQIKDYAVQYVKSFVALGVVNGYEDGTFRPEVSATRAEAAKILFGITKLDNEKVKNAVAALKGEVVAPAGDNTEAVDENAADEAAADDTTADDTTVDDGSAPEK